MDPSRLLSDELLIWRWTSSQQLTIYFLFQVSSLFNETVNWYNENPNAPINEITEKLETLQSKMDIKPGMTLELPQAKMDSYETSHKISKFNRNSGSFCAKVDKLWNNNFLPLITVSEFSLKLTAKVQWSSKIQWKFKPLSTYFNTLLPLAYDHTLWDHDHGAREKTIRC